MAATPLRSALVDVVAPDHPCWPYVGPCDGAGLPKPTIRRVGSQANLVVAPASWSDTAVGIAYDKWAYKAEPFHERNIYVMCFRQAFALAHRGYKETGHFQTFEESIKFCVDVYGAFIRQEWFLNSPQWFNTGIWDLYGVEGDDCGLWRVPGDGAEAEQVRGRYRYPALSACYIQSVEDCLTEGNGILPLVVNEGRLFKMGSGTGTNFTAIRHEGAPMSNGGHSSGLLSFLRVGDRSAGAIKSGGTTRRAAKMVLLDADHPDVEEFVDWKVREEDKVAQMTFASRRLREAIQGGRLEDLRKEGLPKPLLDRIEAGWVPNELDMDFNGEAVATVSGQNANNSIRFDGGKFFAAVDADDYWHLRCPNTKKVIKTVKARDLWYKICFAAWASGDPGVQFDDLINEMNPVLNTARIHASNPCSEYLFVDDTSCNLASVNLIKFRRALFEGGYDADRLWEASALATLALDISVSIASYPTKAIAEGTYHYRTLGLGFSNLGGLLLSHGVPYDSDVGRRLASRVTRTMMRAAQKTSSSLAERFGPFPGFYGNEEQCRRVFSRQANCLDAEFNYRNAQLMVIAPCGTIGMGMDCDTLGIEPSLALVRYKKMADEDRTLILTTPLVRSALGSLGYAPIVIENFISLLEDPVTGGDYLAAARTAGIDPEHDAVFQTSLGTPSLSWQAHVLMLAAVQPFISGGISKTVNLPRNATVEDMGKAIRMAWEKKVKCLAVFRDGCKDAPYTAKAPETPQEPQEAPKEAPREPVIVPTKRPVPNWGDAKRGKAVVGNHTVHVSVSLFPDGAPGEIFIEMGDTGSPVNALMDTVARLASKLLQYGAPWDEVADVLQGARFEPAGVALGLRGPGGRTQFVQSPLGVAAAVLKRAVEEQLPSGPVEPTSRPEVAPAALSRLVPALMQDPCPNCGSLNVALSGTCKVCRDCGESIGGCS